MAYMGICNCYYQLNTDTAKAVALPGAISLNRDSNVAIKSKRVYTPSGVIIEKPVAVLQNAPRITLDVFSLPKQFLIDVLNYQIDSNNILIEYPLTELVPFTLLFESKEVEGRSVRYRYDNCYCSKPNFDVSTIAEKSSISTNKLEIIASGIPISKSICESDNKTIFDNWYD